MDFTELLAGLIVGLIVGIPIVLVVIALATPLYIPSGLLTNNPKDGMPSGFHLFTFIEPGQVKIVVRGKRVVRMIMDTGGKRFKRGREEDRQTDGYWEVIDANTSEESNDPLTDIHPWLLPWARYVYNITGAVFTGIYPFQQVREYKLERTHITRKEDANRDRVASGHQQSNLVLTVKRDYSDHYRVREFLFPVRIVGAETKDKIPLDVIGIANATVHFPYRAAFGTDSWDAYLRTKIADGINTKTKGMYIDTILTSEENEIRRPLNEAVMATDGDLDVVGIDLKGFNVEETNPDLPPNQLEALRAEALAKQRAKATREDGAARADVLDRINTANQKGGEHAVESLRTEAVVRAAEAAGKGGGTVILTTGSAASDPTQQAILATLKELVKKTE